MKRIEGFENYVITREGRVFNLLRKKWLRPSFDGSYYYFTLSKSGKRYFPKVHCLVADAFISKINGKPYVNHIDGDKSNNYHLNLEWVNARENMLHAYENGLIRKRKRIKRLTRIDAKTIRQLYQEGFSTKELSKIYLVCQRHVQRIIANDFFRVNPNELD